MNGDEDYNFSDGSVEFRVKNRVFKVHRLFFERESDFFRDLLKRLDPTSTPILTLENVEGDHFAKLLWVFYNPKYSLYEARIDDWTVILELAERWGFAEVQSLALRELEKLDMADVDRIALYCRYAVDMSTISPYYARLCEREEHLTIEEGLKLGVETSIRLSRARELVRDRQVGKSTQDIVSEQFTASIIPTEQPQYTLSDSQPPSTATLPKNPQVQLSSKSAWAKGPPQTATPPPRSQSSVLTNAPQPTHSRRPSILGQGVPIKDGVSIPGKNVGAVKQGSAVTFGSMDDASAPISSSPATPAAPIKSEIVKSFGTVPTTTTHVNGKASVSKSIGVSSPTSSTPPSTLPSTSSSPAPKFNIRAMFQSPSTPAPPSQPENSSPSIRPSALPQQQPSQPQFTASTIPTEQPQHTLSDSQPPSSPVYGRPPMTNDNGTRPPNGPGPGGPSSVAMGGPRISQNPHDQLGMPPNLMGAVASPLTLSTARVTTGAPSFVPGGVASRPKAKIVLKSADGTEVKLENLKQHASKKAEKAERKKAAKADAKEKLLREKEDADENLKKRLEVTPSNPQPGMPQNPMQPGMPPQMAPQMGQMGWPGYYAFGPAPGMPSEQQPYMFQPGGWYMPAPPQQHGMPQQGQPMHPTPPMPPQPGMPMSPRNHPIPIHSGPGTPTPAHAVPVPHHVPPPLAQHSSSGSVGAVASPPTPSTARLNTGAPFFVPGGVASRPKAKIVLRSADGTEVKLENLKQHVQKKAEKAERKKAAKADAKEKLLREKEDADENLKKRLEETPFDGARRRPVIPEVEEGEVQQVDVVPSSDKEEGESTPVKDTPAKDALRIDTTPSNDGAGRRPGRLNLANTLNANTLDAKSAAFPSALATARMIDDLTVVPYPENIQSPKVELNVNATDGKFIYDREFLLQFMSICKEKPDNLPPLDAIGIGPVDQASMTRTSSRGGTHRPNRTTSMSLPPGGNTIPGFPFPNKGGAAPFGGSIGNFNTGPKTSAERFAASGSAISAFTRPTSGMQHTTSQSGTGSALGNKRTRSKRGEIRDKNNSGSQGHFGFAPIQGMENAAPLQMTANRWDRRTLNQIDPDSPEVVNRKVKGLLNKLTMEKFDSISDQIIEWANKSEKEKDGRTLVQVIRLVFEAATNDERWTELYARFCRKMMEQISPKVQDDGMKTAEGKPIAGSQLIRKYLLNRCQEDFERGWVVKEATAAAIKSAEVPVLYFDEYYAAQKARRQSLGLIKFIGELFKLWMLTGRIMHECVKGLLGNVENPEDIESLCKLISNVGLLLDTQKARAHMDVYFSRMKELAKSKSVSSRMQFMLQDVIELRDRKWATRSNQMAAPSTIAAVHEAAAKEQAAKMAKDSYQRTISMSQGGSRHGADQGEFQGPEPDGWTSVAGSGNGPHPPPKASNFGKFGSSSKAGLPMDLRPSSVFSRSKESKREAVSRTSLVSNLSNSTNMLSTLSTGIVLQPRSKREVIVEMSVEAADRKIAQDLMEFFAIRNIDEAEAYFSALPPTHHARLVDKLVSTAIEAKEGGAQLVADLFSRAASKELCSVEAFEEGFLPSAEILDDVAIDAPKAPQNLMLMMRAVSFDTERAAHIAEKTGDADKLLGLLS